MNDFDHFEDFSISLGDGVDAADRDFDVLLTQMLREISESPAGLADRVFRASAPLLPDASDQQFSGPYRFIPAAEHRAARKRNWSRLAMAASVSLACVIGMKVCLPENGLVTTTIASASEADWGAFSGAESGHQSVTPILGAKSVSLNDILSEMSLLASNVDSEM